MRHENLMTLCGLLALCCWLPLRLAAEEVPSPSAQKRSDLDAKAALSLAFAAGPAEKELPCGKRSCDCGCADGGDPCRCAAVVGDAVRWSVVKMMTRAEEARWVVVPAGTKGGGRYATYAEAQREADRRNRGIMGGGGGGGGGVKKTCPCSSACTCGCNEGMPCECLRGEGEGKVSQATSLPSMTRQHAWAPGSPPLPPPAPGHAPVVTHFQNTPPAPPPARAAAVAVNPVWGAPVPTTISLLSWRPVTAAPAAAARPTSPGVGRMPPPPLLAPRDWYYRPALRRGGGGGGGGGGVNC